MKFTEEKLEKSFIDLLEQEGFKRHQESSVISILETTTSEEKAFSEYDKFNRTQKIESDFDKTIKSLQNRINQGKEDVEND